MGMYSERLPVCFLLDILKSSLVIVFPWVGTNIEVWGVAQRRGCLRGMLSLHAEMLVSPNATNDAA